MRTVIRDEKSKERRVTSGVPQRFVLAPVLFFVYMNDMPRGINSYIRLLTDDALLERIRSEENLKKLRN